MSVAARRVTKLGRIVPAVAAAAFCVSAAAQSASTVPAEPPRVLPALVGSRAIVACIGCDGRFETATHEELLESLAPNEYVAELRKALYFQDTLLQFSSKAHFDNCDFDGAIAYLGELQSAANAAAAAATAARARNDNTGARAEVRRAFYALGQALHGVQDFFAHSNYVEISAGLARRLDDIEPLNPWSAGGQTRIHELRQQGLVSGYVFWGFPQRCGAGAASHADLAKDSSSTSSGRKVLANVEGMNQYQIAVHLAKKASIALVAEMFRKWPVLRDLNGERVAFEVLLDRREL